MCEITSIGEMSAARTTIPEFAPAAPVGDLRSALTTSFTPRFRDLFLAAVEEGVVSLFFFLPTAAIDCEGECSCDGAMNLF